MIPVEIEDWTLTTIRDILEAGLYESDTMEFKEDFNSENQRVARTSCAFANTEGGVIIFGVSDDRSKPAQERIIGLDKSADNVLRITNQIKNIEPQIGLQNILFANPIPVNNNKEILLLEIKKSTNFHSYDKKFYKRLHGISTEMTYDEVKSKFIESMKNQTTLFLIRNEGGFLREQAKHIKDCAIKRQYREMMTYSGEVKAPMFDLFLFNQAYLYAVNVQNAILGIVEAVTKISSLPRLSTMLIEGTTPEFLEKNNVSSAEELVGKQVLIYIEALMENLTILEEGLGVKMAQPVSTYYIEDSKYRK